jgi:hypothetical protein
MATRVSQSAHASGYPDAPHSADAPEILEDRRAGRGIATLNSLTGGT